MSYSIQHKVPLIPQTTETSCWAASLAMMLSWKHKRSFIDDNYIGKLDGRDFKKASYVGLAPTATRIFNRLEMKVIPNNRSFDINELTEILRKSGPIWFARWAPGAHASVITGNSGSTFYINDPWPPNKGERFTISHNKLRHKIESLYVGDKYRDKEPDSSVYFAYFSRK